MTTENLCPECGQPVHKEEKPAKKTYDLVLAVKVSAYGSISVEADSLEEACELARKAAAEPLGDDDGNLFDVVTDIEWDTAVEHRVVSCDRTGKDAGGKFVTLEQVDDVPLTPGDKNWEIITADELAAIMCQKRESGEVAA